MPGQPEIPPFAQAAAGAAGSIVSNTIVYPLDLISTRVQTSGSKAQAKSPWAALSNVTRTKGIKGLYQGLGTDNLSNTLSNFLFFFFRAAIVERIQSSSTSTSSLASKGGKSKGSPPPPLTPAQDLAAGALAGVFSRALTTPLSNVTVRKQTHSSSSSSSTSGNGKSRDQEKGSEKGKVSSDGQGEDEDSSSDEETTYEDEPSIMDIVNEIINDKGIAGLWSGFETAILLSATPALTFYLTNIYTRILLSSSRRRRTTIDPKSPRTPNSLQIFLSSALGNATSTTLLYPLILAKTLLQYRSPRTGRRTYNNLGDVLIKVGKGRRGVRGLYQGLESQLMKGVISHGVTMLVKSRVELGFVWLYIWMKGRK